jgi:dihydroorotate dehydrogenase
VYRVVFWLLRRLDPEHAHTAGKVILIVLGLPGLRTLVRRLTAPPASLQVNALGQVFGSPLGVAAGFDKNAQMVMGLWALGFDHVEVGTVTPKPQVGNPRPRLFRLLADRALINRMGFNNEGMAVVARRLTKLRRAPHRPVVGVNIGKNRDTPLERAVDDYRTLAAGLHGLADYLVVNVSSPNTPGLRSLQSEQEIVPIVSAVLDASAGVPVLVKISPDLSDEDVTSICKRLATLPIAGIIATNTTVSREHLVTPPAVLDHIGDGGLSGHPLQARSQEVVHLVRQALGPELCVIAAGGVETGWDVHRRQLAGADLVQLYTAFVYQGPLIARRITRQLADISS